MEKIQFLSVERISSSEYIRPLRVHFKQDGKDRHWDLMKVHDSVAILLYHKQKKCLVFVKQFRPAVYLNRIFADGHEYDKIDFSKYPPALGCTYELCAGIVDKNKSLVDIAREEIEEECGYAVPMDKIEKVTSFRGGVGVSGSLQTLYYAEIDDNLKVSEGGGNASEHEMIDVVYVPVDESKALLFNEDVQKGPGFMFAVMWFFEAKRPTLT